MTTDAAKQAGQFHVAPQQVSTGTPCGSPELERLLGIQRQPAVIDIGPLVAIIDREMQRLRDQLFVEQSAARSAREALVMCEERLKAVTERAEEHRKSCIAGLGERNRLAVERDNAVAELERCKATMGVASTVPPALTPGTPAAVVEAYRLLCGSEPVFAVNRRWADHGLPADPSYDAERALLAWLNKNAPGGRP